MDLFPVSLALFIGLLLSWLVLPSGEVLHRQPGAMTDSTPASKAA